MPLSRRPSAIAARIAIAAALIVAGSQPVVPQARGPASPGLRDGQEIVFTSPQFVVQALWFKANDETNWYWQGSDEVYAVFSDLQPDHYDHITSTYGNVDEGDLVNFGSGDRCVAPQGRVGAVPPRPGCQSGLAELNARFSFWEQDGPYPAGLEFCPGWLPGSHQVLENGKCGSDDLIGWGAIVLSRDELVAMLPAVGDSREFTHVMDKDAGKYRFRYRITRLADVDRPLVIHLPPIDPATPPITLQASPYIAPGGERRVMLSWSGATTASVDVYRDGAKVATVPNTGAYRDPVTPGTFQYRVCNLNSTTACSATVSVTVT